MNSDPSQKSKMSEIISEMAGGFIGVGKTPEEKQSRLTAACSAWNMACGSPDVRQQQLEKWLIRNFCGRQSLHGSQLGATFSLDFP
jgi:hypothetical protein